MNAPLSQAAIGDGCARFKRFGPFGPAYEVLSIGPAFAKIRVIESGEELDYPLGQMQGDIDA